MRASTDDVHDTPYQIDFGASQDGWTAVDMSETPGKTWAYNERGYYSKGTYYPCVAMTPDYSSAYDDWYVSPPVRLRAGVEYEVRTLAFNSIGESRVQLYVGTQDGGVDGMTPAGDIEMGQDYAPEAYTLTKVSVGEDGAYRFALRGTTEMYVPDWACLMSFAVDEADRPDGPGHAEAAVPYGIDFTSGADGWTAADINGDGATWQFFDGMGMAVGSSETDDNLISPMFTLKEGTAYTLTVKVACAGVDTEATVLSMLSGSGKDALAPTGGPYALQPMGEQTFTTGFTAGSDGTRCFAVSLKTAGTMMSQPLYVTGFSISEKEEEPQEGQQVFVSDFTGGNPAEGWTLLDMNGDGASWTADTAASGLLYDGGGAGGADDMAVTPGIRLMAGHDYIADLTFRQSGAYDPDLVEVTYGTEPTAGGMSRTIGAFSVYAGNGSGTESRSLRFTAGASGTAFIGVRVVTPEANGTLTLTSLTVTSAGAAVPRAVTGLKGNADANERKVELTWINPLDDTGGMQIMGDLKANVYHEGILVATAEGQEPGKPGSCVLRPEPFWGKAVYEVRALLGGHESEAAAVTVDLADVQGTPELVMSFEDVNRENASGWVIEDRMGKSAWEYDYGNVFSFNYKPGQTSDDDWLISPAADLRAGERYIARYELKTSESYGANVDVTVGAGRTWKDQTQVIASYQDLRQNGFGDYESCQFSVEADGGYSFAFHAYSSEYSVSMRCLKIYRIVPGASGLTVTGFRDGDMPAVSGGKLLLPCGGCLVSVFDMQGRLVMRRNVGGRECALDGLAGGVYVIRVRRADGKEHGIKIIM